MVDSINVYIQPKPPREKRGFVFGDYDTAAHGWTLTSWEFEEPELQEILVDVPGRPDGPLDLSDALTNGDPYYNSRGLTATFECSDGTRDDRNALIYELVNALHGRRLGIILPDDQTRYITGRLAIKTEYSDMAHASVTVSATCAPWRYSIFDTRIERTMSSTAREVVLTNNGRKTLVPEVTVTGTVTLICGDTTWTLSSGTYKLPGLKLRTGSTIITYSGSGAVSFAFREAIL